MADISGSRSPMRWIASAAAAAVLAGCAAWPGGAPGVAEPPPRTPVVVEELLELLDRFIVADSESRSDIYLDSVGALAVEPTAENRLRLALLQGWPGHAQSRPRDALRLADAVLDDDSLDDDVRELARVLRFWIASHRVE